MSYRESSITRRPSPRRRMPIWRLLIFILVGIVVLFAIGFGVSLIFRGSGTAGRSIAKFNRRATAV